MKNRYLCWRLAPVGIGGCLLLVLGPSFVCAQSSATEDWEKAAGGKMSFDVASVKQNTSGSNAANTNFSWTMGTEAPQTGGLFLATNWPLYQYIFFAYKPALVQQDAVLDALPKWAKTEHFDIEARTSGKPTADQYRLMMQALLAERFKLTVHFETQEASVFALIFAKPGKFGPQLRLHLDNPPCGDTSAVSSGGLLTASPDGFPTVCGRVSPMRPKTLGRLAAFGGRDVTLADFVSRMGYNAKSELGQPLIDGTGLSDKVDLFIEWTPPMPPGANISPETQDAPGLAAALNDQLGLKLESTKTDLENMIIDHIEEPTPN
jgi:bla regulator protein BlaR1